jgi:tetratricopeptide (TPR) repeat protein
MDPDAAFRYVDRGGAYYLGNRKNQAIRDYSRAIELDPKLVPAYERRGDAYIAKKQEALAEADYKTAAKLSLEKGIEFAEKGEDEKAIRAFNRGIKRETEYSSTIFYHRGLVYDKKGDYEKAVSDYTKAIKRNPGYGEVYQRRGRSTPKDG